MRKYSWLGTVCGVVADRQHFGPITVSPDRMNITLHWGILMSGETPEHALWAYYNYQNMFGVGKPKTYSRDEVSCTDDQWFRLALWAQHGDDNTLRGLMGEAFVNATKALQNYSHTGYNGPFRDW